MANFDLIWKGTKGFEGGYQALSKDSGNYCPPKGKPGSELIGTNMGISAIAYKEYFNRCPSVSDMKNLAPDVARKIAKTEFWDSLKLDKVKSQAVAHLIFDGMFMSGSYGPEQVRKAINSIKGKNTVKVFKSFSLSDQEVALINSIPEKKFFTALYAIRKAFLTGQTYEKGYLARIGQILNMYQAGMSAVNAGVQSKTVKIIAITGLVIGILSLTWYLASPRAQAA